jgi:formylglycine-generating enzyme
MQISRALLFAVVGGMISAGCGSSAPPPKDAKSDRCPPDTAELPGPGGKGALCVDKTEVTVAAYAECVGKAKCSPVGEGRECNKDGLATQGHPVNCVDWSQAAGFCEAGGRRLPTEEEWEWVANGGGAASFDPSPRPSSCWSPGPINHVTCSHDRPGAPQTPQGVVDLQGNVAEWTSSGTEKERVARGGWYGSTDPSELRPVTRRPLPPATRAAGVGFRCVKTLR